jgi:hypothetical protein
MTGHFSLMTIILLFTSSALATEPLVYTGLLSNTALGGYDSVSYFESGQPAKGSARTLKILPNSKTIHNATRLPTEVIVPGL